MVYTKSIAAVIVSLRCSTAAMVVILSSCANAQQQPSPVEMADTIKSTFQSLPGLHVKWSSSRQTHTELDAKISPIVAHRYQDDEFAISGDRLLRRHRHPYGESVIEWVYVLKNQTLYWQSNQYNNSRPDIAVPRSNYTISTIPDHMWDNLHEGNIYNECIGSPFYDGNRIGAWQTYASYHRLNISKYQPPHSFSVEAALRSGDYRTLADKERIGGLDCWVVEAPGRDKLWLAVDQGLAVVQREVRWTPDGPLQCRYRNDDFRHVGNKIWLPYTVRRDMMVYPKNHPEIPPETIHISDSAKVRSVQVGSLPDKLFEYTPPLGSYAVDDRILLNGERVTLNYRWGETPEDTERYLQESLRRFEEHHAWAQRWRSGFRWSGVIGSLLLVGLVFGIIRRSSRLKHSG
jgi:hypothetical protein